MDLSWIVSIINQDQPKTDPILAPGQVSRNPDERETKDLTNSILSNVTQAIKKQVKCHFCDEFYFAESKIPACKNNLWHVACELCRPKMMKECPFCRQAQPWTNV